jgi:hypothetical protein
MSLSALEITAISGVVVAVGGNFAAWAKLFSDRKEDAKRGNGHGGETVPPCPVCPGLVSRVALTEGSTKQLSSALSMAHTEDRQDHDKIFGQLGILNVSVALATERADAAQKAAVSTADKVERRLRQTEFEGGQS